MHKLKNKLALFVIAFAVFTFILFLIFNGIYIERKNKINALENRLYTVENDLLISFNDINTLLLKSINDSNIVFTDQNLQLLRLQKNLPRLNLEFSKLNTDIETLPDYAASDLNKIIESYHSYIAYLNEITELLKKRAETNTGILAKLNKVESKLYSTGYCNKETLNRLTFLSRSYLLYKKQEYIDNINWTTNQLESEIQRKSIPYAEKVKINSMISQYNILFSQLHQIDMMLDIQMPVSYTNKLIIEKEKILHYFEESRGSLTSFKETLSRTGILFYSVLFILIIVSALIFNGYIERLISTPLKWLTDNIVKILYDKHEDKKPLKYFNTFRELENLYKKILVLLQYLKDQEDKRQVAQKELRQSEHRYRELSDMLPQSIYETDSLGNLTYVNRAWHKTFGFDQSDMTNGINIVETMVSETGESVMGNRKFIHSEFIGVRKDGTTFPALVYSNQVLKNGKVSGIRGIVIDNSERKKYIELLKKEKERAENLDKMKTSFLADMSHELRTPMNAIMGFSDLLASLELNSKQKEEFISHINQSSQHILHLIDDIIDLAKIEAGELKINKKPTNVNKLFSELHETYFELLKNSDKQDKIKFTLNLREPNMIIDSDAHRLKQILNNLLGNAFKFTHRGEIELGYQISENNLMTVFVKDTGIGIDKNNLNEIFNRYNQVKRGDDIKGKGLGLSISKKIIELLGGKIWVESEPDQGTCFYFSLPVVPTIKEEEVQKIQEDFIYNWKDKLILVAEDEDLNFRVVKEFISKTGAKVMRAYDGEEVVDLCKNNHKIDLVVMDIKMPRKNGYEATLEIKRFKKELPIVALTAYALYEERNKCLKAGCDEYIAKPFQKELFLKTLNPFLSQHIDVAN